MFKEILKNAQGIEWLSNISVVFFFIIFVGIVWWAFTRDKGFIDHMSNLPLESADNSLSGKSDNK